MSYKGRFFSFDNVYFEPEAYRPDGPRLWFGGQRPHRRMLERLARYGHGFHPLGRTSPGDLQAVRAALAAAGRDPAEVELVGGTRAVFRDALSCADLGEALAAIPEQLAQGITTFCLKPSQFVDHPDQVGWLCREVMRRVAG